MINVVTSLLKQLVQEHETIPQPLQDLYERYRHHNTAPPLEEVSQIINSLTSTFDDVFFVIDALDECCDEIRWALIEVLRQY